MNETNENNTVLEPHTEVTASARELAYKLITDFDASDAELKVAASLIEAFAKQYAEPVTKDTSDGYHTFRELYEYRRVYNALLFNEWASRGIYDVHKSKKHSDGEDCFGGGWFIVVAQLPAGQISNHYKLENWDDFQIPERELPNTYDGHNPATALDRAKELLSSPSEPVGVLLDVEKLKDAYAEGWRKGHGIQWANENDAIACEDDWNLSKTLLRAQQAPKGDV